jgi:hypothetical protein
LSEERQLRIWSARSDQTRNPVTPGCDALAGGDDAAAPVSGRLIGRGPLTAVGRQT